MEHPASSASEGGEGLNRRDFSRLGLAAGGFALAAPSIRTISFAGKVVGTNPPPSTEPPPDTASTTTTVQATGSSVTTAPNGAGSTVGPTGDTSTTTTTAASAVEPAGASQGPGSLPLTGAALGGLAVVGGAAIAAGRAIARAARPEPLDQEPDDIEEG